MRIGFHIPFSGSLNKLEERVKVTRGNTFQVYARSLRGRNKAGEMVRLQRLNPKRLQEYYAYLEKRGVGPVIVHAPYSYNLAKSVTDDVSYIQEDLMFASKLKAQFYVLQTGYFKGMHPFLALGQAKLNLQKVLKSVNWEGELLIKNMSGAGTEMASTLEDWNELITFHPSIKGALDLGRLYDHGIPFQSEREAEICVKLIEEVVGWDKIKVIYINDTIRRLGERKNKFVPLGEGVINYKGYEHILSYPQVKEKIWIVENQSVDHYDKTIEFVLSFYE